MAMTNECVSVAGESGGHKFSSWHTTFASFCSVNSQRACCRLTVIRNEMLIIFQNLGEGGEEEERRLKILFYYFYLKVSKVTYHFSNKICWWLSTFLHLKINN